MVNKLKISQIQTKNPLIKEYFKSSEYQVVENHISINFTDYEISKKISILFLALDYNKRHPGYLLDRIQKVTKMYDSQILLVLTNLDNAAMTESHLFNITEICLANRLQLILAFSYKHAAKILKEMCISRSPSILSSAMKSSTQKRTISDRNNLALLGFDDSMDDGQRSKLSGTRRRAREEMTDKLETS